MPKRHAFPQKTKLFNLVGKSFNSLSFGSPLLRSGFLVPPRLTTGYRLSYLCRMLYVSQILNRPVFDARNERIAVIKDVLVRYGDEEYPPVIGLVARYRRRNFFMPSRDFTELGLHGAKM